MYGLCVSCDQLLLQLKEEGYTQLFIRHGGWGSHGFTAKKTSGESQSYWHNPRMDHQYGGPMKSGYMTHEDKYCCEL